MFVHTVIMVIEPHMKQGRQHKLISTIFLATSVTKKLDHNNKKTVEEDDKDKPIMKTDPTTGEKVETGEYEKKKVDYEYVTDYGWYDTYASSPDGKQARLWDGVPEASGSIYPIDDHSWWEYDQQWPDQSADAYYKIWLTKAGDSWSPSDETYYRSETADADSDEFLITTYEIPHHTLWVLFFLLKKGW